MVIQSGEVRGAAERSVRRDEPGATVVTPVQPGTTVVTPAPPVVAPGSGHHGADGLKQTFYGTVTDVDKDGDVRIKTQKDSFEIKVGPEALRQVKKGDAVTLDLTIAPSWYSGGLAGDPITGRR